MQSFLCGINKCPSQSTAGGGLASISMLSSVSSEFDSIVVVALVVVIVGGIVYVGFHQVVGSYVGCSVTLVDSMSISATSITIGFISIRKSEEITFGCCIKNIINVRQKKN